MKDNNEDFSEYFKMIDESIKKEASLFANYDYINWLEKFTERYPVFTTEDFNNDEKVISQKDKENLNSLITFFNNIEKHAKKNYIDLDINREIYSWACRCITIKYKDIFYKVGFSDITDVCFVSRTEKTNEYLDFELVIKNKMTKRAQEIKEDLSNFKTIMNKYIEEMLKKNVPFSAISEEANSVLVKHDKRYR
jgi:hypothetical protein